MEVETDRDGPARRPVRLRRRSRCYEQELEIIFTELTRIRCSGVVLDELCEPDMPDMLPLWLLPEVDDWPLVPELLLELPDCDPGSSIPAG